MNDGRDLRLERTVSGPSTFAAQWELAVLAHAGDPFLVFEGPDGAVAEWTYAEFDELVGRVARTLDRAGVGAGDAVHLALTNSPAFVAVWLAANRLGAWIVPSDPMAAAAELAGHLARTRPVVGCCSTERAGVYRDAVQRAGLDERCVFELDEADTTLAVFGSEPWAATWPLISAVDRAAVMFTSGTTGAPKGVEITQANYAFAGSAMACAAAMRSEHRMLVVLPLFHANAQYYCFAAAIAAGASVALMHTFSASGYLEQCARHRATHLSLFAAPMRMILARGAEVASAPLHVEHCWYAMNLSPAQLDAWTARFGCRPRQLYGMTETIPAVLTDRAETPDGVSMGTPTPGCVVDLHDADGFPVHDPDVVGEIVVGGEPGITLFAGYLDDPATTAAAWRGEWFRTGDRARRDAEGRFVFDGRRADVLKVSGENVSTVEVEQAIAAHPAVLEAAVVGQPDAVRDEVPVAFVVPRDPACPPSADELHAWCAERLGKAKRPAAITLVDALPRTSVGKIRKFLLRDPHAERLQEGTR